MVSLRFAGVQEEQDSGPRVIGYQPSGYETVTGLDGKPFTRAIPTPAPRNPWAVWVSEQEPTSVEDALELLRDYATERNEEPPPSVFRRLVGRFDPKREGDTDRALMAAGYVVSEDGELQEVARPAPRSLREATEENLRWLSRQSPDDMSDLLHGSDDDAAEELFRQIESGDTAYDQRGGMKPTGGEEQT